MSAPYTVTYVDRAGCTHHTTHATIADTIKAASEGRADGYCVSVHGDSYDCDCDDRGYYVCDDGFTEEEREALEEAGVL